ncbi:MAG: hypothetical protein ACTSRG_01345 [Candidatus Helarchaeota archaeon]
MNEICEKIFQIEEQIKRPEVNETSRAKLIERFSSRFAQKMFGNLMEKKWQRKYKEGGLKKSQNLDQIDIEPDNIISGVLESNNILVPPLNTIKNITLKRIREKSEKRATIRYLKYALSPITAKKITQSVLTFSREVFLPLNELSGNSTQSRFAKLFIDYFVEMIDSLDIKKKFDFLIPLFREEIEVYKDALNHFQNSAKEYFKSGIKDKFEEHMKKFKNLMLEKSLGQQKSLLLKIFNEFVEYTQQTLARKELVTWEFKGELNYFIEYANHSISSIFKVLPIYLSKNCEIELLKEYIQKYRSEKLKEQEETIQGIADTYLKKFEKYVTNQIYEKYLEAEEISEFNQDKIEEQFPKELMIYMDNFIEEQNLTLEDLIEFSGNFILPRVDSAPNKKIFDAVFNKLKRYPGEVLFLTEFLQRYSVFNTFLLENEDKISLNPDSFSEEYLNYINKRLSAISLSWSDLLLNWMDDFNKENIDQGKLLFEQVNNFINFIEEQEKKQLQPEAFLENLEIVIELESDEIKKALLKLFSEIFQQSIELRKTIPTFLNSNFKNFLQKTKLEASEIEPKKILLSETENFQEFQENLQVKAYSKFIVKPLLFILENKNFPDIQYQIKFNYLGEKKNKIRVNFGSNFSLIQKPWM